MMPLEGYRLLDLSRLQPGPSGTHVLADMGMEVVKVEETEPRGGMGRDVLTPVIPTPETEVLYSAYNAFARNKKSIAINLRTDEGREGVKLEEQILITENGVKLLSTYPFEVNML